MTLSNQCNTLSRLCAGLLMVVGCTLSIHDNQLYAEVETPVAKHLEQIVQTQAEAWNRGDIDAFMEAYWKSEKLTFSSGGGTTEGWEATRQRYHARYPDQKIMGKLKFTELHVELLGDEAALMLGNWHLDREHPAGGNFSLVWRKIEGKWVIVHDHSSAKTEE